MDSTTEISEHSEWDWGGTNGFHQTSVLTVFVVIIFMDCFRNECVSLQYNNSRSQRFELYSQVIIAFVRTVGRRPSDGCVMPYLHISATARQNSRTDDIRRWAPRRDRCTPTVHSAVRIWIEEIRISKSFMATNYKISKWPPHSLRGIRDGGHAVRTLNVRVHLLQQRIRGRTNVAGLVIEFLYINVRSRWRRDRSANTRASC